MNSWLLSFVAWVALLPAAVISTPCLWGPFPAGGLPSAPASTPSFPFPAVLPAVFFLLAFAGPAGGLIISSLSGWHTGLASALWVTVVLCQALFWAIRWRHPVAAGLTPLLMPYLVLLGGMALLLPSVPGPLLGDAGPRLWIGMHIAVSVLTYALVTLASLAALAAFLQERALRRKRPTAISRALPALTHSEWLQIRLLGLAELVLSLGLMSGMILSWQEYGRPMPLDHKTLLSFATFVVIGALLWVQIRVGLRGRQAGRLVLVAYLLLTLAYPGVKFVTEILLRKAAG